MFNLKFQEVIGLLLGPEAHGERIGVFHPLIDVYENADGLCIEAEIPGVCPEDVSVEVMGRSIVISGTKKDAVTNRGVRYIRMERGFGKFTREFEIPERFNLEQVDARFMDGVLKIRIARIEEGVKKVKRIEIS
ncbi:MAG TPA: Hsp20/alpha crystallin family protein [Deltaproteobacteria bacterium]|nr:Hsp20/alpha crystallin family protein [Deltaproteobacteria bacterium]HOM29841.1 Hsp20/alpha crystallin family protein [Deltaproteobacteria bacterium]HPP80691.1 Hsp20/alpha crystallin family protein [Deltaproteobacteria bacterium]